MADIVYAPTVNPAMINLKGAKLKSLSIWTSIQYKTSWLPFIWI